jgi:hypothetical protein
MIYELRLYAIEFGRIDDMRRRVEDHLIHLFARHGIVPVRYWEAVSGPVLPRFVYLVPWVSDSEREAAWGAFYQDPEWLRVRTITNAGSQLVQSIEVRLLTPEAIPASLARSNRLECDGSEDLSEIYTFHVEPGQTNSARDKISKFTSQQGENNIAMFQSMSGTDLPAFTLIRDLSRTKLMDDLSRKISNGNPPIFKCADRQLLQCVLHHEPNCGTAVKEGWP